MAEHALETNHEINWSSAKVVDISNKFHKRVKPGTSKNWDDEKLPTVWLHKHCMHAVE